MDSRSKTKKLGQISENFKRFRKIQESQIHLFQWKCYWLSNETRFIRTYKILSYVRCTRNRTYIIEDVLSISDSYVLSFVFFFFDPAGHCSYNVYPRLGYGMTEVRILETCNFSYPLSIHFISSRTIVCPTCCQVHPSIRLEETKSNTRTSVYATSFRYRFTSSLCTRMYLYATAILCSHTSFILFVCSCPIVED